ncbi:CBS domain-containing protein [Mucilaginibacter terrigena]|uniref:CBS domain-containing protein n=1 Tax=Mucilaginibacter terrigena TaxID=2492395 RepID=A0A4V1ZC49_9SPHI|nr:chloride channel protein [Mucilaginibacter terrigena]RYU91420.1 CBS domain-containing protein [Mucilaginibacter terrigena]
MKKSNLKNGIPISPLLTQLDNDTDPVSKSTFLKARLLRICVYAVAVAAAISCVAKVLVALINMVTNISFYGDLSFAFRSPAGNHWGLWVILVPAIGGIIVGFMALYGSKAIRGHGIPEAMEQILVNESNIKPSITFLKPISSAIAIGTGGPFGAEGPIIATGGALGSTLGQLFEVTANERKIILAAGATAGMSAIFGTPIAAVFLAIELLLFEFSPKSILPVALACITGAAGHHLLFESGPVFPMPDMAIPSNLALGIYSFMGLLVGLLSLGITKIVYFIEDVFEELPIHWMWWPAIGGLAVGVVGYFSPHTLGVGYDNITGILSGTWPLTLIISLCLFKFLSWAIALGSGTSGGTLAPLLTIGGASGAIIGYVILMYFPNSGITLPMAALIGMSAMFAGASRAFITSIVFALEATMQSHALLPLLGACTAAYIVSFFLMENTIMTEKIARRGISTPDSFEPDILQKMYVSEVIDDDAIVLSADNTVSEVKGWLSKHKVENNYFILVDNQNNYGGTLKITDLYNADADEAASLSELVKAGPAIMIKSTDTLHRAVENMSKTDVEVLPILSGAGDGKVIGVLSYKDIIKAYQTNIRKNENLHTKISLRRQRMKIVIRGKKLINLNNEDSKA